MPIASADATRKRHHAMLMLPETPCAIRRCAHAMPSYENTSNAMLRRRALRCYQSRCLSRQLPLSTRYARCV